ncbi:hypothetical protein [Labedaea rhizosphaerae]|uniref:Uncharacterized protein n=1 Tax=Labedaea rhizosphaerae TaxID=598644 RepID=A0A4R6SBS0_LABRH|nr:hypothetical protein [Labedaea rhizosphaerae]TDP96335.1 hypothetical protein EV186_104320 [Labedaea rhizosphaerae]
MTDAQNASCWLRRNDLGWVTLTPTLTERLAARRQGTRAEIWAVAIGMVLLVVWGVLQRRAGLGPGRTPLTGVAEFAISVLVLVFGAWLGMRVQRRREREVAARMRTRVTHPGGRTVRGVLGRYYATAAVLIYAAGIAVGAVVAAESDERAIGVAFTVTVVVLGMIGAVVLFDVLRRPALAAERESLAVDDALRRMDARRAVTPYPVVVALVAGVATTPGSHVLWWLIGYGVLSAVLWGVAELLTKRSAAWTNR